MKRGKNVQFKRGLTFNDKTNYVRCINGESLLVYGKEDVLNFQGMGIVRSIKKGENYDMVVMSFGKYTRKVLVNYNRARRQIYTLKCGQYAQVFGKARFGRLDNGINYLYLYALAIQGWYVPKALDIKKSDEKFEALVEEQETDDFLKMFENIGDDENV